MMNSELSYPLPHCSLGKSELFTQRLIVPVIKEPVNGLTHLLGTLLAFVGIFELIEVATAEATGIHVIAFFVYGISLTSLYLASAMYHSLRVPREKELLLRQIDHCMIYILICGTYTPVCLIVLPHPEGISILAMNILMACLGIRLVMRHPDPPPLIVKIRFCLYLAMGWLVMTGWGLLVQSLPDAGVDWLVAGGVIYTVGACIMNFKDLRLIPGFVGAHEVWHCCVLAASFCHYWVMLKYVMFL